MDKEQALSILDGGETYDIKKAGDGPVGTIKDPYAVIQFFFGGEADEHCGTFRVTEGELDYGVHRIKNVTLSEKEEFYMNNQVEVDVYTLDDDNEVVVQRYQATEDGWKEV